MMSIKKHFTTLGLKMNANEMQIKKAYRNKAKLYHPDVTPSPAAAQLFIDVNIAYEILLDYKSGGTTTYSSSQTAAASNEKFHGSQFTKSDMEEAWAKQRKRERDDYEVYLKLPWYSPIKLLESLLKSIALILVSTILLFISLGLLGEIYILIYKGAIGSAIFIGLIAVGFGYFAYCMIRIMLNK